MTVTVVVVNWNSGALLQERLNKLSRQTVIPQRTLVVDNASADGSAGCAALFPGVALLNPDAFPKPDWLERLLAAANANPDFAAWGSRQLSESNPDVLDGVGDRYHMSGLVWRERHGVRQATEDLTPREIFSPCAAAALYRRQAVVDVGGFDEDYFCYVEDVDLGFRLRLAGHKALYVPDYAGAALLAAVAPPPDAESGFGGLVRGAWARRCNLPRQTGCAEGLAACVGQTPADSARPGRKHPGNLAGIG